MTESKVAREGKKRIFGMNLIRILGTWCRYDVKRDMDTKKASVFVRQTGIR